MILEMDIGNSALKWRLCSADSVLDRGSLPAADRRELPELASAPEQVWVASVAGPAVDAELAAAIADRWRVDAWFANSSARACGITNSYREPERMGVDRWLAMIAAWRRCGQAVCVVDAGSALTIDFLDDSGVHRGGYILPGIAMMERSLLGETARVRFQEAPRDRVTPGKSTEEAVFNGLQLAQVGAISLALDRYGRREKLLFTGGNGATARQLLERGGDLVEDLVLEGLSLLGRERDGEEALQA